jgi:excisionase family DNA binding protein
MKGETMTWYTYKEVAEMLQVSTQTVRYWVKTGKLRVMRLGHRTVRISSDDIGTFQNAQLSKSESRQK